MSDETPRTGQPRLPNLPDGYTYSIRITGPDGESLSISPSVDDDWQMQALIGGQARTVTVPTLPDGLRLAVTGIRGWVAHQAQQEVIKHRGQEVLAAFGDPQIH
jgi:glucose/arabinose dehydrogenase